MVTNYVRNECHYNKQKTIVYGSTFCSDQQFAKQQRGGSDNQGKYSDSGIEQHIKRAQRLRVTANIDDVIERLKAE